MSACYLCVLTLLLAGAVRAQDARRPEARPRWSLVPEIRHQLDGLRPSALHPPQPAPVTIARSAAPRDKCVVPLSRMAIPENVQFHILAVRPDLRAVEDMPRLNLPPICPPAGRP